MRLYSRVVLLHGFASEDGLLVLAWASSLANTVMSIVQIRHGAGRHIVDLNFATDYVPFQKLFYATTIDYQISLWASKISLCLLYLRVFGITRASRWFLYVVLAILTSEFIAIQVVVIYQCQPISDAWKLGGHCFNIEIFFWVSAVINILADVVLLGFAFVNIRGLNMPGRQRTALMMTLCVGWLVVIAAVIRVIRISALMRNKDADPSWRSYDVSIWTAVEINVAILVTSAPGTKPLLQRLAPRWLLSSVGRPSDGATGSKSRPSRWRRSTIASKMPTASASEIELTAEDAPWANKHLHGITRATSVVVVESNVNR